ncbi:MAG: heparan-alpha-glucosaminide N-acetyltransferase domain-containing protein [Syntrophales bacterium]|jgi:hypothetical protein
MKRSDTNVLFSIREALYLWRQKKSKRYEFLDHFRGIMILCMILNHCAKYFWFNPEPNYYIRFLLWLDFFIAANFLMISGFAYNYYIHSRKIDTVKKSMYFRETILRAIVIYGIATLMSVLFGNLGGLDDSWSHWSIFKIIGIGMIIILIFDSLPRLELWLIVTMVIFFFLGYLSTKVENILLDFFSKGAFALFPWFYFFGSGFLLGKCLIKFNGTGLDSARLKKILLPALVLIVLFATPFIRYDLNAYIELNLKLFLGNIGLFFWFLAAFYYITENAMQLKIRWVIEQITEYGKISFSLYYVHFALIFLVLLINANVFAGSLFLFMNAWRFTGLLALLLAIFAIGCLIWKKIDYVMSLEWFIYNFLNMALRK